MGLIHNRIVNKIVGSALHPFRKIVPPAMHFAIANDIKVSLPENQHIKLTGNVTSNLIRVLFWRDINGFEYSSLPFFIHLAKHSAVFFDIGSNIGYYSLVASTYNPSLKIFAFEALPSVYKFLLKNVELNGFRNIHCENIALSNAAGNATFRVTYNARFAHISDQLVGDGTLSNSILDNASTMAIDVKTQTIDAWCTDHQNPKVDLIKLDTEATEHLVLQGGANAIKRSRPVMLCEVIRHQIEDQLMSFFEGLDYLFFLVTEEGLLECERISGRVLKEDFFFVPVEKRALVSGFLAPASP